MITLPELSNTVANAKNQAKAITTEKALLEAKIAELESSGKSESWIAEQVKQARQQSVSSIQKHLTALHQENSRVAQHEQFFSNKMHVMSKIPLTERNTDQLTAKNPYQEAITKAALLEECKHLPDTMLQQRMNEAKIDGDYGSLYIMTVAGMGREKPVMVDLADVTIPEYAAYQRFSAELKSLVANSTIDMREASGERKDSLLVSRLAAGRLQVAAL